MVGLTTDAPGDEARDSALRFLEGVARRGVESNDGLAKVIHLTLSPDHLVRKACVSALLQIPGEQAQVALVTLLNDINPQTQAMAADALGKLEATMAVSPLKGLLESRNGELALRAAAALGRLKDRSGLPVAIRYLRRDGPHTRLAALAFGMIVGQQFHVNDDGVAKARRYLKTSKR